MRLEDVDIIQGGMGVGVSDPWLANAVSRNGCLGTVSSALCECVLARSLQQGDPTGRFRRALAHFPFPQVAQEILETYFVAGGKLAAAPYKAVPVFSFNPPPILIRLAIGGSFAQVWLAKEGHQGLVSINCLEKIQLPLVFYIFGAMLAGVDCITVGAGIPIQVPAVLDLFSQGREASYKVTVSGNPAGKNISFDPRAFFGPTLPPLRRPHFLPIIASHTLAAIMANKSAVDGFVVENEEAGGHSAPPRGALKLDDQREPVYGPRDQVDWSKMREFGKPFWIGGAVASPKGLAFAKSVGARGIQVGSIFALSNESAFVPELKAELRRLAYRKELKIRSNVLASPTGFPFKVASLAGTLSEPEVYEARRRVCNKRSLAQAYQSGAEGQIFFRCPADVVENYVRVGGKAEDCEGRCCLCNTLLAAIGLGDPGEPPIITIGKDVAFISEVITHEEGTYWVVDAIRYLRGDVPSSAES